LEISSAAKIIRSANTRGQLRLELNARSATKENSSAAAQPRDAGAAESFTAAAGTRNAILRRRTNHSTSRARSVARPSSSRSEPSKATFARAFVKTAIGKFPRRYRRYPRWNPSVAELPVASRNRLAQARPRNRSSSRDETENCSGPIDVHRKFQFPTTKRCPLFCV
jgi:hypothetical protein